MEQIPSAAAARKSKDDGGWIGSAPPEEKPAAESRPGKPDAVEASERARAANYRRICEALKRGENPVVEPDDYLAGLIAEKWGRNAELKAYDQAWLRLWRLRGENDSRLDELLVESRRLFPGPGGAAAGLSDSLFDEEGGVRQGDAEAKRFLRRGSIRHYFRTRYSYSAHLAFIERHGFRAYRSMSFAYKNRRGPTRKSLNWSIWARDPIYDFAQGNHSRICTGFHGASYANSDMALTQLFDPSVFCLEINDGMSQIGQAYCVLGRDAATRDKVLLVDSLDVFPDTENLMRLVAPGSLRVLSRLCHGSDVSRLWINTRVHTAASALFVKLTLAEAGISTTLRKGSPGEPRLLVRDDDVHHREFERATPWSEARNRLATLGLTVGRCYLDAFGGTVDASTNREWIQVWPLEAAQLKPDEFDTGKERHA